LSGDETVSREIKRFRKSLRDSRQELLDIKTDLKDHKGIGSLFVDVHIMILDDKTFVRDIIKNIKNHLVNAEWAVQMAISRQREIFDKIEDDYLRDRIKDVEYVGQRILRNLSGKALERVSDIEGEVVIVARDLSPADTVQMATRKILGFATDIGGKTSHTAIVAKSIEIPAVVGLERITEEVSTGSVIIVDGTAGVVIINPDLEVIKRYEDKRTLPCNGRRYAQGRASSCRDSRWP